jgi:hypothetical protein
MAKQLGNSVSLSLGVSCEVGTEFLNTIYMNLSPLPRVEAG